MTAFPKLASGAAVPATAWQSVGGGTLDIAAMPGWRMLAVYRGKHCPLCKKYFATLDGLLDGFKEAGVTVVAVSADPKEKAEADVAEFKWRFPVGYGMTTDDMRRLGLYISEPRSAQETDRPFAEPGLYVINPEGRVQIVEISNAPFARPDLSGILHGIKVIQERSYPIRGTMG
jgi:peroxiredoxin